MAKSKPVAAGGDTIDKHSGNKYLRKIHSAHPDRGLAAAIHVDVYAVLAAFKVTCPGRQQAVKKLLCSGLRGKGSAVQDLKECRDAVSRAIELAEIEEKETT